MMPLAIAVRRAHRGPRASVICLPLLTYAACGQIGPPLPPLRLTPQTPTELTALQRGDQLRVSCRAPKASVDGVRLPLLEVEIIWLAGQGDLLKGGQRRVERAAPGELLSVVIEDLPEAGSPVRVTALARTQRQTSKPASVIRHTVQVAPLPPRKLSATRVSDGVHLAWEHPMEGMLFRVYRRPADGSEVTLLTPAAAADRQYDDRSEGVAVPVCYQVRAAGLAGAPAESQEAEEACVAAASIQPPAAPQGLAAVAVGVGVDLSWSPTSDPVVVSYHVHRAIGADPPVVCGEVSAPATTFRDEKPPSGQPLSYTVTALSRAGLESPQSAAAVTRLREP